MLDLTCIVNTDQGTVAPVIDGIEIKHTPARGETGVLFRTRTYADYRLGQTVIIGQDAWFTGRITGTAWDAPTLTITAYGG